MNLQRVFIISLFIIAAAPLTAQEFSEKDFDHYTKSDGLSNNNITGIAQDAAGYIWISTLYGLNRYDGSHFVQYHSNDDSLSLASDEVSGMTWLDKDRLAVYANGLHIVNTKTGKTRNLFIPYHREQYLYKFNMIVRAKGGEDGNIYVLARSGFYAFDKNYKLIFRFDYYSEEAVFTEHFFFGRKLLDLDKHRLLIVSIDGLYAYDKQKKQVKKIEAGDYPALDEFLNYPDTNYEFFQQKPGRLFVMKSTSDSFVYINTIENKKVVSQLPFKQLQSEFSWRSKLISVGDTIFYFTCRLSGFYKMRFYPESGIIKLYPEKLFDSYWCNYLLKDKNNTIWIATSKGLFRENPQKTQVQLAALPVNLKDLFPNIILTNVYVCADKVYAGTHGLSGLLMFDKKTLRLKKQIQFKEQNNFNQTNAIVPVNASELLVSTSDLLFLFNQTTEKAKPVKPAEWEDGEWTTDLHKDAKGNIWIGSSSNVYQFNPVTDSFNVTPVHNQLTLPVRIKEDNSGNIWMASHGLARYNKASKSFDMLIDSFPFIKMPDRQVNAFLIDKENTVWFNSNNNGLIAYNINNKSFRHFTRKDGLPDNNIASMIIINKKLWIATYSGIACMNLQTSQITRFGKEDGFPDMPINIGANFFYDSSLQQLYVCFYDAIVRFNPEKLLLKKTPPQLFIESVKINGDKNFYLPGKSITTSWRNNEIVITIGSINFSDGNSQAFAYRILKDSTTPWQQLGEQTTFNIFNLSPGTNKIQVKCFSLNNRWTEQVKEISIVVLPPFWMKGWFIILMIAIAALLVSLFIRWRISTIRKKEMEKTHIQKLKADDYKNQFELEQISNYFSSSLAGKKTEEEVLWDVTSNLMRKMSYEDCVIYLWNKDKTKMVQKAAYGPKGKPEIISANVFEVLPGQGIVGEVIQTRKPVLVDDTRTDNRYRVDDAFRLSEVSVPIIHNNELLGVLDSEHSQPGYFGERDIKILTTIATLIGNKLKQLESEQSLEAKQEELATINEQLAEARLAALQAQMNPHFVFNALNSIKRMILDGENDKASRYLSKFAQMIRMTLDHSKEIFVTLDENIQYLNAYLEMEHLRFDDSFSYKIFAGENIDIAETVFPTLMIQPIVENAIWHGLMPAKGDKKITVKFIQHENKLSCVVEDNGIGIHQSEKLKKTNGTHHSLGLENLQRRIKIINEKYQTNCSLEITDLSTIGNNGTRVILKLNVISN